MKIILVLPGVTSDTWSIIWKTKSLEGVRPSSALGQNIIHTGKKSIQEERFRSDFDFNFTNNGLYYLRIQPIIPASVTRTKKEKEHAVERYQESDFENLVAELD